MTCTPITALSCPVCGDCTCGRRGGRPFYDNARCPLHGGNSKHADTVELAECERIITEQAERQGIELTEHDHKVVSRFAQYLKTRHRQGAPPPTDPDTIIPGPKRP